MFILQHLLKYPERYHYFALRVLPLPVALEPETGSPKP